MLSSRQRRALETICDTFCPDEPSAGAAGVPEALLELVQPGDRASLMRLLSVWDLGRRFSSRPRERREDILRGWRDSRLRARRQVFNGLRKGSLIPYYGAVGLPGYEPFHGAQDSASPPRLRPLPVVRETSLDCDVCVVGSGAGGGVAAGVLAAAGLDVVVLEAGGHYEDRDFDGNEADGYRRLYLGAAAATTDDGGIGLLAGECLGGTTTINYTTSFRTPDELRVEWGEPFAGGEFSGSLDAVWARLGVNLDEGRPSARDAAMGRGLEALGWHVAAMPRNVRGCEQGRVCGYCGFGCPLGAKQSTLVTWLADAQAAGARILVETRAERVLVEGGRATGVEARTRAGRAVHVQARAVVVACGALQTPVLLRRSGVTNPNVGRHLHLHPTTGVSGVFAEEIRPWEGTLQALYSDEHRDLDGDGYGLKYETAPVHPGVLVAFSPWGGAREHAELVRQLPRLSGIGLLVRDRSEGEVRVGRDGRARIRYRLTGADVAHVRAGLDGAARIFEAAGAERIFSSHARLVSYVPGPGARERFLRDADACGYRPGRCTFYAFHPMGSARIGPSSSSSACRPDGQTWDVRGLYVLDGSTFPSASGVNPMITIEAIAHLNASRLAAELS